MILIVGLGNPEPEYADTRHNFAVTALKPLAESFENKFDSLFTKLTSNVFLSLPQTFMNESGKSISQIIKFYKIPAENIWVVHDDVDLPLGKIRNSFNSSAAGHRGVQSIIDHLGTQNFWRIRLGIGRPPEHIPTETYVLQKFSLDDTLTVTRTLGYIKILIEKSINDGLSEGTYTTNPV
ncbi:MAG: aminoacyl-tRNA hydrolase [Patescibacteria group bacterium]|jgi:PTH1 family peptidyl-tRNA hydrolase